VSNSQRYLYGALLLFLFPALAGALNHLVKTADTLYSLSQEYDVPISWIMRVNELENPMIHPGQILDIPSDDIVVIAVRPGDTIYGLALEFGVDATDIRRINNLRTDVIAIDEKLEIPLPAAEGEYRVLPGDTLLGIAHRHDTSAKRIKLYNNLEDDVIYPGQTLTIAPPRPEEHRVREGESLWTIARRYDLDIESLQGWNHLRDEMIRPGQLLALFPGMRDWQPETDPPVLLATAAIQKPQHDAVLTREKMPSDGEYYFSAPQKTSQPNASYWESADDSAAVDFERARRIWDDFFDEAKKLSSIGRSLRGWHIVLDPGHGGLDPGAIIPVADGDGNPVVITEDEYAYDISMRLARVLIRHGASVDFTVLAPDHQIRNSINARHTFVHRKNEVYNDREHNKNIAWRPVGTIEGLDLRKTIASRSIAKASSAARRQGTLFIAIHADNSADLPDGKAVLFDGDNAKELAASQELAAVIAQHLGTSSFLRQQSLRVLKNNPADAAVLVEARNIHYPQSAWALRSDRLREQDALMICEGILAWARRH